MLRIITTATAILVASLAMQLSALADDDDDYIPISSCNTQIFEPGKYQLTNDLLDCFDPTFFIFRNGITVFSNDVTIDLNGHMIRCGVAGPDDGITVGVFVTSADPARRNVRVRNGVIEGCSSGVLAAITNDSRFEDLVVRSNFIGINMISGFNNRIKDNRVYDSSTGIQINADFGPGGGHDIKKNLVAGSGFTGIDLFEVADSDLKCNRVEYSGLGGIVIGGSVATGNRVLNNVANNNGGAGIAVFGLSFDGFPFNPIPTGNTIKGNTSLGSFYDIGEFSLDVGDNSFNVLEGATCANGWKNNGYVSSLGPENCFAPPKVLDDDDDDGCAPGDGDDDDDEEEDD